MSLVVKGKVTAILDTETGTSKAGKEWAKKHFVIDNGDKYNPSVCFEVFGQDNIDNIFNFKIGQDVEVSFNLSSREHKGKWYTQVSAWRVTSGEGAPAPAPQVAGGIDDDLPF